MFPRPDEKTILLAEYETSPCFSDHVTLRMCIGLIGNGSGDQSSSQEGGEVALISPGTILQSQVREEFAATGSTLQQSM